MLVDAGEYVLFNLLPVSGEQVECARDEFYTRVQHAQLDEAGSRKLGVVASAESGEAPPGRGLSTSPDASSDYGVGSDPGSFVYVIACFSVCPAVHALWEPRCAVSPAAGVYTTFHEFGPTVLSAAAS